MLVLRSPLARPVQPFRIGWPTARSFKAPEINRFFELLAEIDENFKFLCVEEAQEILATE
jgi:hypothetical protein